MQSKLLVVFLLALAVMGKRPSFNQLDGYTYEKYLQDFPMKKYASDSVSFSERKTIFEQRLKEISKHNSDATRSWSKGVNHMSDWTDAERKRLNGNKLRSQIDKKPLLGFHLPSGKTLPRGVDYRKADPPVLTSVKDQGFCGSCWAHSATESIESAWAMKYGQLYVLSQEQITACTPDPDQCGGTGGCGGNIYENGFDYVIGAGGIAQEWSYPYESYFGETGKCLQFPIANSSRKFMPVVEITGYTKVPTNDAEAVKDALHNVGPLSISLDASEWFDYEGGIFTGCNYTNNITIDHGVQLVGYGTDFESGMGYWIVRNSWNAGWGENGFIRLQRHEESYCGWNNKDDTDGIGCNAGKHPSPNNTYVCGECGLAVDAVYVNVP